MGVFKYQSSIILYMFNKYEKPNYIISFFLFLFQISFGILVILDWSNFGWISGFIASWALGAMYGGWIQWIGAKHHHAHSYIISAGFGLQVPLLSFMTIYFTYRFIKGN